MSYSVNFLPRREADLVTWTQNFATKIATMYASIGITTGQATSYGALSAAFVTAFQVANDPATRSPSNIIAKDQARVNMVQSARALVREIQGFPGTTDTLRSELGITVRAASGPIPAPGMQPVLTVTGVSGKLVKLRITDPAHPTSRARPAGVATCTIFSFVGPVAPTTNEGWVLQGTTTRNVVHVLFGDDVAPGSQVWLCAYYSNAKGQQGLACSAVGAHVGYDGAIPMVA